MARVLITNFHPHGGGGHVPYIKAILGNKDHEYGVAAPATSRIFQYLEDDGFVNLYPCNFPAKVQKELPSILRAIKNFRQIIEQFKPDIVHVNGGADLFIAIWAYPRKRPFKIVRTHHAIKSVSDDFYHRWIYKQVANNIYVSRSAMELSTSSGLNFEHHEVIENGIDLEKYVPAEKDQALLTDLNLNEGVLTFGSCAGTGHYKRVDVMIRAAKQLNDQGVSNFRVLALGDQGSGSKLQALADELGVENFNYCGFSKEPERYVSIFDVGFVLSDSIETISFAAREMMAMGKPLISSSFSGLKENVVDGENGLLTEPGNVEEVANAMHRFITMESTQRQAFASAARQFAEQRFDIKRQQQLHADLYNKTAHASL